jgi:MoaA/NifB/PqqE/SkfB family radical SAM enzyme
MDQMASVPNGSAECADPLNTEAFKALTRLVHDMRDGLDHPEIWPLLRDVVDAGEHVDLLRLLRELRPAQAPTVGKIFDVVEAVVLAVGVAPAEGIEILKRLEAANGLCPQVAGAFFYVSRLQSGRSPNLEAKFCAAPFEKFETLIDGTVAPCCSIWTQKRLGRLDRQNFEQIWNSADAQQMRASILDGSFRYCNKRRCTHIVDDALPDRNTISEPHLRTIIDRESVILEDRPRWLFLAHDWTCNLACPSCRSGVLGASEDQESRFSIVEREVFHPLLQSGEEMLVSVSGQGDPWSSQHYRSLLRHLAENDLNVRLNLHTNALLMTPQRWEQYAGLEKYHCAVEVSIDACSPWVYKVVRFPGIWDKLEPNLKFVAAKRGRGEFREFHLNATVQLDNFHEIGDMVDYARHLDADSMRLYMIQNTGGHLARDFVRKNVAAPDHPLHLAFLETLRDPRLGSAPAHLYDVRSLREASFNTKLPSDCTSIDSVEGALQAMRAGFERSDLSQCVALASAAKVRHGHVADILDIEADALDRLGFRQQAAFRRCMAPGQRPDTM